MIERVNVSIEEASDELDYALPLVSESRRASKIVGGKPKVFPRNWGPAMTLFLDYDGVLHPDEVYYEYGKPVLRADGELFMWAPF
ncbi:hypothetical protein GO285_02999 [Ralstonia solanacearum]|nr:hypothetical protein [Ralstonia solanacearum]NKF88894.1 hypothetical protein [Ralstonia solanacearum]NKF95052.1 hypothetical protein [Ralstonia solanacearum]NKG11190.1 hypothetical protein [Ralstonia solanacearum]